MLRCRSASSARLNWKRFSNSGKSMWNDLGPIASTLETIVVSVPPANAPATACLSRSGVSASMTSE